VAVFIVDPPTARPAGSLGLFEEDLNSLRQFRSHHGAGSWFERDARKVLSQATRHYREGDLRERDRITLFEQDDELQAVTVLSEDSAATAELAFLGVSADLHGARIDSPVGDRLSEAVVESTLDSAGRLDYRRVTAYVAHEHDRCLDLLTTVGFEVLSQYDHDYSLLAISVT
jgi:hypothetical protein